MAMAGLLALGYVSVFIDPAKAWFFTFFGLLYPLSFLGTLLLFIWALFRRSRMRGLLLAALLPSLFFAGRYVQFHSPETDVQPTLKMVSYNVGRFSMDSRHPDRLVLADSVSRWLRSTDKPLTGILAAFDDMHRGPTEVMTRYLVGDAS